MLYQTAGTILAGRIALVKGWCINLGGGFHHCSSDSGSGFCPFADITLGIQHLRKDFPERVKKVMIVDLDAHQGNGHERDFMGDKDVFIMDMYNPHIFPGDSFAKKGISRRIECTYPINRDVDYLATLKDNLANVVSEFNPDIIFYNGGTDCMKGDPLGAMNISPGGIIKRDEIVFTTARTHNCPIVMVLSGGYQMTNADVIADSLINLNNKINIFGTSKGTIEENNIDEN